MTLMVGTKELLTGERVLVVGNGATGREILTALRRRYANGTFAQCDTYLSAIAELAKRPARTVLACVTSTQPHLADAVAGLRLAAGEETNFFLCCTPDAEPLTRSVCAQGANDYLLLPLQAKDLDQALGVITTPPIIATTPDDLSDLRELGDALKDRCDDPMDSLRKLAEMVRRRLGAKGVSLVVEGSVVGAGERVNKPVLTAPLLGEGRIVGQILVGEPAEQPYDPVAVDRLRHLATIFGHLIGTAARQRHWQRLALTDEISGLPNRRYLREQLPLVLARAKAERFPVTLLLFDVDDFKHYNDVHGHDAGDEIIRAVGQLFRTHCREQDVVVRYGGDEFAVAFWDPEGGRVAGSSHPESALRILDRFTLALSKQTFTRFGGEASLTVSGGLATFPWDADNQESLVAKADEALLGAKRAGKNRILVIGGKREAEGSGDHAEG